MTESFDRSKPLYRAFKMEDGSRQWWSVELKSPRSFLHVVARVRKARADAYVSLIAASW